MQLKFCILKIHICYGYTCICIHTYIPFLQREELQKSLSCLRASLVTMDNTYTAALMAYVFTLAGDMETRAQLLQHLDKVAVTEGEFMFETSRDTSFLSFVRHLASFFAGGLLHWDQKSTETSASLSVEISSYVILAKLSHSPSNEDLGYASRIVRWLTTQQNYYGGFYSTQVRPKKLVHRRNHPCTHNEY